MATLEKIRSRGGLLVTIIGVALLAFILGDLNQGLDGFRSRETVGKVNGDEIKIEDFNREVNRMTEVYKIQFQQTQLNDEMQEQIRQMVWDNMVRERVMSSQFEKLGIAVSPKELSDLLMGENIHPVIQNIPVFANPETGRFDREMLLQFINSLQLNSKDPMVIEQTANGRSFWFFWENFVRNARLEEKYNILLSRAMSANSLDAQFAIETTRRTVDLVYAMQPFSSIPDSVITVTDSELKAEYERVKQRFEQAASRDAKYIVFEVVPTEHDARVAEEYINRHKEEFATANDVAGLLLDIQSDIPLGRAVSVNAIDPIFREFAISGKNGDVSEVIFDNNAFKVARIMDNNIYSPDSVKVRHIVIAEATPERTTALTDSLLNVIRGGADFAALAREFSVAASGQNNGEVGWVTEANIDDQKLADQMFRGGSNLFKFENPTGNGAQIIQIQEKTKPVRKIQLAVLQRAVEASSLTSNQVYNAALRFIAENNTLEKFEQGAAAQGLDIRSFNGVTENDPRFAGLRDTRRAVQWLFEGSVGDVSRDVFQSGNTFIAVAISNINKEGFAPLANIEAELKQNIITEKKAAKIIEELSQKLKANNSIEALGLPIDSLANVNFAQPNLPIGFEPRLVGMASVSKVGAVSAPLQGTRGVFVFQVTNEYINPGGNPIEFEKMIQNQNNSQLVRIAYDVLKKAVKIVDNRSRFF